MTVVASPLGEGADGLTAPFQTRVVDAAAIAREGTLSPLDALASRAPGAFLSDVNGNAADRSLDVRGFGASGVPGASQGLAVYLGGVRLNEAFGDTVNFDLVPQIALSRLEVVSGDPAFGLNALGGAVVLTGKTGADEQGGSARLTGGSFGRVEAGAEAGGRAGPVSWYVAGDGGREDGWRRRSPSAQTRLYGDLGYADGAVEAHLKAAAAATALGVVGPTPADLLSEDRRAVFTSPQTTRNDAALVDATLTYKAGGGWRLSGDLHARTFNQRHTDGNDADIEGCGGALRGTLCLEDDAFPRAIRPPAGAFQLLDTATGRPIPCPPVVPGQKRPCAGVPFGTIDRTRTDATTLGASGEAAWTGRIGGLQNRLTLGLNHEASRFTFASQSTLGLIGGDLVVTPAGVPGAGAVLRTAGLIGYAPLRLSGDRQDDGAYALDALDLTDRLTLTVSGRWNRTRTALADRGGTAPDAAGTNVFSRFNPQAGVSFRFAPRAAVYASYTEASRAPTPLELACSDPARPCLLENALVADPPLKAVVARTAEIGLKGSATLPFGRLSGTAALYDTRLSDDILPLASAIAGRGAYANVPSTRRRGVEASLDLEAGPVSAYASYAYVEATYGFDGALASPNSPSADASGTVQVARGDRLGGVPAHRFKLGADWRATPRLVLGADLSATGPQRFVGDESNQNPDLPAFAVMNLHAALTLRPGLVATLTVRNLFDSDAASYGTYFSGDGVAFAGSPLPADPDPRTVTPLEPRSVRLGLSARW